MSPSLEEKLERLVELLQGTDGGMEGLLTSLEDLWLVIYANRAKTENADVVAFIAKLARLELPDRKKGPRVTGGGKEDTPRWKLPHYEAFLDWLQNQDAWKTVLWAVRDGNVTIGWGRKPDTALDPDTGSVKDRWTSVCYAWQGNVDPATMPEFENETGLDPQAGVVKIYIPAKASGKGWAMSWRDARNVAAYQMHDRFWGNNGGSLWSDTWDPKGASSGGFLGPATYPYHLAAMDCLSGVFSWFGKKMELVDVALDSSVRQYTRSGKTVLGNLDYATATKGIKPWHTPRWALGCAVDKTREPKKRALILEAVNDWISWKVTPATTRLDALLRRCADYYQTVGIQPSANRPEDLWLDFNFEQIIWNGLLLSAGDLPMPKKRALWTMSPRDLQNFILATTTKWIGEMEEQLDLLDREVFGAIGRQVPNDINTVSWVRNRIRSVRSPLLIASRIWRVQWKKAPDPNLLITVGGGLALVWGWQIQHSWVSPLILLLLCTFAIWKGASRLLDAETQTKTVGSKSVEITPWARVVLYSIGIIASGAQFVTGLGNLSILGISLPWAFAWMLNEVKDSCRSEVKIPTWGTRMPSLLMAIVLIVAIVTSFQGVGSAVRTYASPERVQKIIERTTAGGISR